MSTKKFIIDLEIIPYFKKKNMKQIKASDIRAWQNVLMKKEYSETYLKTVNNQLSAIFNYAVSGTSVVCGSAAKTKLNQKHFGELKKSMILCIIEE